jgi:hypothetical protein
VLSSVAATSTVQDEYTPGGIVAMRGDPTLTDNKPQPPPLQAEQSADATEATAAIKSSTMAAFIICCEEDVAVVLVAVLISQRDTIKGTQRQGHTHSTVKPTQNKGSRLCHTPSRVMCCC